MAQPPSFPFYAGDWIAGTATLSLEAKGAYIDMLAHQWNSNEGVPGADFVALSRIIRASKSDAKRLWSVLSPKFVLQPDGTYRNARLEREREAKARYYEAKRKNGEKGGRPRLTETPAAGITDRATETKPIGYPPSPSPLPSVPTEQRDAREARRRPGGDPFGFRPDVTAVAHIVTGTGVVAVPERWWAKAVREYGLAHGDAEAFASWCKGYVARHGFEDGGKRLQWLDARLADWRAERARPSDGYVTVGQWMTHMGIEGEDRRG
jgi:uncharacterized protein YdaU (DUF1376 family)